MTLTMLSISFMDLYGQCDTNDFPVVGYSGINTFNSIPKKMFDIHGRDINDPCRDVTLRLSYHEKYDCFLTLLTDFTKPLPWYTSVPSKGFGDVVLVASRMGTEYNGGNIILQTRDSSRSIILATRSLIAPSSTYTWYEDVERQKIYPTGRVDFNIGNWNYGLGKITLFNHNGDPTIKFYRPTGNVPTINGESFPFWIKSTGYYNPAYCYGCYGTLMDFMSGQSNTIGFETTQSLMTLRLETSGNPHNIGYVGINDTFPIAGLHVKNRNVLFEGDSGGVPVTGAGTRFMWIPEKAAIRAGYVSGTEWDTIGNKSVAFGHNNKAIGDYSAAFGKNNKATENYTTASGHFNLAYGEASTAFGESNISSGKYSTSSGDTNLAAGYASTAFGALNIANNDFSTASGDSNFVNGLAGTAFGKGNSASGDYSTVSGKFNIVEGEASVAIGKQDTAGGDYSAAFGSFNKVSGDASFVGGSNNIVSGKYSAAFGYNNVVNSDYSGAFGINNTIQSSDPFIKDANFVVGDSNRLINCDEVFVSGVDNIIENSDDCAAIGHNNHIKKHGIAFGWGNNVFGTNGISLGTWAHASGSLSTAMGRFVSTNNKLGSFIIGDHKINLAPLDDSTEKVFHSTGENQFTCRFMGQPNNDTVPCFRFITKQVWDSVIQKEVPVGIYLYHNGVDWVKDSDRNLKKNILPVDLIETLNNLRQVPVKTWEWKNDTAYVDSVQVIDSSNCRWMGPMAQDFYSKFPIGIPDSTKLCTSVMEGAMFASIQALANITDTLKYGVEHSWGLSGVSATTGDFIGTTNSYPLIFKTNSIERMRITDEQIICHTYGGDVEEHPYIIYTSSGEGIYTYLASDGTGWFSISDKNKKENFFPVDGNKILESIDRIPVTTWNFKKTALDKRYMGPMAQDFYREFPLWGKDSLAINSVIFDGVNFSGIKALINRTGNMQNQINASLSKSEFNKFKDSIVYKDDFVKFKDSIVRNDVFNTFKDSVVKNDVFNSLKDSVVKKDEFNLFKDSLSCLKDACDKIKELEEKIKDLLARVDSLERKGKIFIKKNVQAPTILSANSNYDDIILEQNNPNPFAETSSINYYIPVNYQGHSSIILADERGSKIYQKIDILIGLPGQTVVSAKELKTGVYIYGIELNGKIVKSKKLMIIK
ncbi:MAG: hypothetical protein HW421_3122 [Ignavibacteria bacterium]|nr:hypothetical protein [Ignavibacteria bacterium]